MVQNLKPNLLQPLIVLKTHLLQSCKDFFIANNLDPKRWTHNPHTGELTMHHLTFMFNADVNRPEDPDGYQAEITVMGRKILMPASRMVHISYWAGYIDSISSVLPLNTISFNEMKSICADIASRFEPLGFKSLYKEDQMTEQEFHENGGFMDAYGEWQIDYPVPAELTLEMENFNRMATTFFITPLTKPTPRNAQPAYLIHAYFSLESEVRSELSALTWARNLAVNGDRDQYLPLKVWFDDPDWRPANWQGKWLK